jgi:hypothetical protein
MFTFAMYNSSLFLLDSTEGSSRVAVWFKFVLQENWRELKESYDAELIIVYSEKVVSFY